jgi:hypothetical protein
LGGGRSGNKARDFFNDVRLGASRRDYWQFGRVRALEERLGVRSTFYVYAWQPFRGRLDHRLVHLLLDPHYDIRQDGRFQSRLPQLLGRGWDIGLHGSLYSYVSKVTLAKEKQILEEVTGSSALSVRQHWLWLAPTSTWRFQEEVGLLADTTLGFNDCIGFRAGIATAFPPYDWGTGETRRLLEIPMVFMDSTLFDYARLGPEQALDSCIKILEEVRRFGGCVSINWHQRTMAADYGWYGVYEDVLSWVIRNGGRCVSVGQYLREAGVA